MKNHETSDYPHDGGCEGCRDSGVCNVCGTRVAGRDAAAPKCTNGRCMSCHRDVCTGGGDTTPGHGYGSEARARAVVERLSL